MSHGRDEPHSYRRVHGGSGEFERSNSVSPINDQSKVAKNVIIVMVRTYWRQDNGLRTSFSTVN